MSNLSDKIKAAREALRLSQAEVARRLEMDAPAYHRLEKRGEKLSIEQATRLANVFGMSLIELLTYGEERPSATQENEELAQVQSQNALLERETEATRNLLRAYQASASALVELIEETTATEGDPAEILDQVREVLKLKEAQAWRQNDEAAQKWLEKSYADMFGVLAQGLGLAVQKWATGLAERARAATIREQEEKKPLAEQPERKPLNVAEDIKRRGR